ncbi:MAG: aminomethyl-transferring glycine dehydrogenase subunit GcvPA [Elusimicrobia bacterium]|nr:aminomethyl-transferring glycine dehydrogenase subunit GcvPA [Elusimicrobiota bacterium]
MFYPPAKNEIKQMLETMGISSTEELFSDIKQEIRSKPLRLEKGKSELEVYEFFAALASWNIAGAKNFAGGGFYDHYIPAAVDELASRSEFYTPYTPYQAECSQGTLQAIFEYQTAICRLTEMDASNASVYDGGTALAEAALMAVRITGRKKLVVSLGVNPIYIEILKTYLSNINCEVIEVPTIKFSDSAENLLKSIDGQTACVILQNPNFFGSVSDFSEVCEKAHSAGALAVGSFYPVSLGILKTPGDTGFDIATGEGQSLGNPLNFGGPYFGFMTTKRKYIRNLPGRIVGMTKDVSGRRGFVLTLQAREQHIRRSRATSNICTNENLCALRAVFYLALIGGRGLENLARNIYSRTRFFRDVLSSSGIKIENENPVFNEFVVDTVGKSSVVVYKKLLEKKFVGGIPLGGFYPQLESKLLVSVTEKTRKEDMEEYAKNLSEILKR